PRMGRRRGAGEPTHSMGRRGRRVPLGANRRAWPAERDSFSASATANPVSAGKRPMSQQSLTPRWRPTALLVATFALAALVLISLAPARSRGQSLGEIQGKLQSTRAKLDHARGREQVLTSDISALSGRIRTLEGQIAGYRNKELRAQTVLDARRAELAKVKARYDREY